jgi:hypothetical protein
MGYFVLNIHKSKRQEKSTSEQISTSASISEPDTLVPIRQTAVPLEKKNLQRVDKERGSRGIEEI